MNLNPFSGSTGVEAKQISEDLSTSLYDQARGDLPILGIRPYRGDDGLERGERLLKSLHDAEWSGYLRTKNTSPAHAFELLYTDSDEILQFRFAPGTEDKKRQMLRQLQTYYPDSDIQELSPQFMDAPEGKYVAGARLELMEENYYYPIKHYKIEESEFAQDPFDSITSEMVGSPDLADTDVLVQMILRPAISSHPKDGKNWYSGIPDTLNQMGEQKSSLRKAAFFEQLASTFTEGGDEDIQHTTTVDLDDDDVYQVVKSQYGEKAYHLNFRIIAVSDDPEVAEKRVANTAGMYRKFYNTKNRQGFRTVPYSGGELDELLKAAAGREWVDRDIVMPIDTATGACHVPTDLNTQQADYSMTTAGKGVPPRTPRFDFDAVGLDRATSPQEEKQRALLSDDDPGNPIWYGWGTKNGVEAGVEPEILNVHQFVGGSTGMGKTTLLINYFRQIMQRGHGGLFFDPKGDDADDVVSLVPEGREEDLLYLDIGADSEYEIGFNFLEVPLRDPELGTASTEAAIEALADDLEALLAQSGSGGGWHARMSGITRSVVRGLAQWQIETERDVTMLDMYYALLDDDGRQEYADMMAQERIEWIEDYAQRVLTDIDQQEVEPLIRRLKEWVESGTTRRIVSHPSSTISIEDAVREGKIIVVRNRSSSDTAKRLIATALIRRIWIAIREQTNSDDEADPPKFYTVIDEFDKIVSKESEIHNILREARAFGLSLTLACQNLETGGDETIGLPDGVQRAIQGNCKTFLTFDPGDPADAREIAPQHSPDIEPEHLTELSKYHIYMRTHDDRDEKTDSYKAKALAPALDTLPLRDEEETEQLIAESQERHGQKARTSQEIKEDTLLYPGETGDANADEGDEGDVSTSDSIVQATVLKAVYDAGYYSVDPNGFVALQDAADRIRRYLNHNDIDVQSETPAQLEALLPVAFLEIDRGDGLRVRCTDEGKMRFLSPVEPDADPKEINENTGGFEHAQLMRDAYDQFLDIGLPMQICAQNGDDDPDARAMPDVSELRSARSNPGLEPTEVADLVAQFREQNPLLERLTDGRLVDIEAEHSTGDTAPATTLKHIARSVSDGRRCLLLARPDTAEGIARRLDDEPKCMRSFNGEDGAHRLYNTNAPLRIGPNDVRVYRPAGGQSVWLYHEDKDTVELQDSDGETLAMFDDPEDAFEDPTAFPATEADIGDASKWSVIKRPIIPPVTFGDGGLDREMVDVIAVDGEGELAVLEDSGEERTLIGDLADDDQDDRDGDQDQDDYGRGNDNSESEDALAGI